MTPRRELGVGLVELLVVMVIVALLGAIVFSRMHAAQDTSEKALGRSVARAYYEVANDFASDNGGAVPVVGSANWPSAELERGPVNHLNVQSSQRYLRTIPEAIGDGRVRLVAESASAGSAQARVQARYTVTGPQTFEIVLERDGTAYCRLANGPGGTALPEC